MVTSSYILGRSDKEGNELYLRVHCDEQNQPVGATISLKLKSEGKTRQIGNFYPHDRSFHVVREKEKHLLHKANSYGFNWNIINDPDLGIENIHMVVDCKEKYVFPKSLLNQKGEVLFFKQSGFELQKFIPLDVLEDYKQQL